ncbi:MAG: ribonuclease J [bacterium]|nr:ribonuclease J [bacterium]
MPKTNSTKRELSNNKNNAKVKDGLDKNTKNVSKRDMSQKKGGAGAAASKQSQNSNRHATTNKNNKQYPKRTQKKSTQPKFPLLITPLGGIDEIGKNITLYEYNGDMFLVDCGMSFPDEEMPGIDIVIPDFSHIVSNADKIKGLIITHGHEDHIGAVPYLLKKINVPIYATKLTLGLVEGKLREHGLSNSAKLVEVRPGSVVELGCFKIEFIHVNHSIPDAVALAITTPAGVVVQTGDFKVDTTPIDGDMIDLARFAELGKKGVLALLSDSTNAERAGFSASERIVGDSFYTLFKKAEGRRIIVATFSSNIHRLQQIIDEAVKCGRKVVVSGRSMLNTVTIAEELGYLKVPNGVLISIDSMNKYLPEQLVVITTGSQGEPMSALHRMAFSDHRKIAICPGDLIIISATPIPGNEKMVNKVVNELMKLGAEVVYEKMYDVHVSGHACVEELKLMLSLVKPKFFIPVHGEQKHLVKHARLAQTMGIPDKNTIIANIGNVIQIGPDSLKIVNTVPAGRVLVDGLGVGDVGSIVLRDRKHLAEDGIFVVVTTVDSVSGEVVAGPDVISRGFVYVRESEELIESAKKIAWEVLDSNLSADGCDRNNIKNKIRDGISKFLYEKTRRSPMVLPIIMDI